MDFLTIFSVPGHAEILLVAAFVFVVVLLLGLHLKSTWHWSLKAGSTLLAGAFFVLLYTSVVSFQGWPTRDTLPEEFQLLHYEVSPPNKILHDEGFIVLWTYPINRPHGELPRAYQLDYDREFHQRLQQLGPRLKSGERIGVQNSRVIRKTQKPDGPKDKRKSHRPSRFKDLQFFKLKKPQLPSKDDR